MLKITKNREAFYPVTLSILNEEGESESITFQLRFRLLTRNEQKQWAKRYLERAKGIGSNGYAGIESAITDESLESDVIERITNWKDVSDESGEPIPFHIDALNALIDSYPPVFPAIEKALWTASQEVPTKKP